MTSLYVPEGSADERAVSLSDFKGWTHQFPSCSKAAEKPRGES